MRNYIIGGLVTIAIAAAIGLVFVSTAAEDTADAVSSEVTETVETEPTQAEVNQEVADEFIGNAPTAYSKLCAMYGESQWQADFIEKQAVKEFGPMIIRQGGEIGPVVELIYEDCVAL